MSDKEEGARQRDCVGRDPEVGQQWLLTRAQRRPLQLERSELPERRLRPGVGFYKCHQAVLWLRVGNMNNLNHTFKDFSGFQDFSE